MRTTLDIDEDVLRAAKKLGKLDSASKPCPNKPAEIEVAIQAAPERAHDPECPYDPNDPAAVEAFWSNATVRRPGQP